MITIYTDGAYDYNHKVGAWAAVIVDENGEEKEIFGNTEHTTTTSNRMELLAVLEGLFTLSRPTKIKVVSDSKYVVDSVRKGWLDNWIEEAQVDRVHFDLWRMLYNLIQMHEIEFVWVKGHSGHYYNELCDKLAGDAMNEAITNKGVTKKVGRRKPRERIEKDNSKTANKKGDFYAVAVGRKVGVYTTWNACNKQVKGFSNARYKKFNNENDAKKFVRKNKL